MWLFTCTCIICQYIDILFNGHCSSLKRMSVIFESQDMGTHIVCKGAAEVLKDKFSSVPSQFDKVWCMNFLLVLVLVLVLFCA